MEPTAGDRALVLGGGGSTGNAWLIGVVAGLAAAGLDVTTADRTVGTSAGATAAAQLAGAPPAELLAAILDQAPSPPRDSTRPDRAPSRTPAGQHVDWLTSLIESAADAADLRRRLGHELLDRAASSDDVRRDQWRSTVAARLPTQHWPERALLLTAVDALSGDPVVFDRHSGVDLVDAVAASCASGFAYRIGDRSYIDGGYRANAENADLAAGAERVLVLSPFGGRSLTPEGWGQHLATQVEQLRAGGSRVETVLPDADADRLFGPNAMDLSLRPVAACAGYAQGQALAEPLERFWR